MIFLTKKNNFYTCKTFKRFLLININVLLIFIAVDELNLDGSRHKARSNSSSQQNDYLTLWVLLFLKYLQMYKDITIYRNKSLLLFI